MDRRLWTRGVHRVCEGCGRSGVAWNTVYGQWHSISPSGRRSARLRSAWHQLSASWGRCRCGAGAAHFVGIWCATCGAAGTTGWRRRRCGLGQKSSFSEKRAEAVHGETSFEERVLLAAPRRGAGRSFKFMRVDCSHALPDCCSAQGPRRGCWQCELCVARQPFSSRQLKCVCKCPCCSCAWRARCARIAAACARCETPHCRHARNCHDSQRIEALQARRQHKHATQDHLRQLAS